MSDFEELKGKWKHIALWDSDDYLAVYTISGSSESPVVEAKDLNDGEEFIISEVSWAKPFLSFKSFMPSTKRSGLNKFWLNEQGKLECEFTFTVVEKLERDNT